MKLPSLDDPSKPLFVRHKLADSSDPRLQMIEPNPFGRKWPQAYIIEACKCANQVGLRRASELTGVPASTIKQYSLYLSKTNKVERKKREPKGYRIPAKYTKKQLEEAMIDVDNIMARLRKEDPHCSIRDAIRESAEKHGVKWTYLKFLYYEGQVLYGA